MVMRKVPLEVKRKATKTPVDCCPFTRVLEFLSGAWTHQILWALGGSTRRFGDLMRMCDGVSAKVLTARLKELEEHGVITRTVKPTSPPSVEYALTPFGRKFEPILKALTDVGGALAAAKN